MKQIMLQKFSLWKRQQNLQVYPLTLLAAFLKKDFSVYI